MDFSILVHMDELDLNLQAQAFVDFVSCIAFALSYTHTMSHASWCSPQRMMWNSFLRESNLAVIHVNVEI